MMWRPDDEITPADTLYSTALIGDYCAAPLSPLSLSLGVGAQIGEAWRHAYAEAGLSVGPPAAGAPMRHFGGHLFLNASLFQHFGRLISPTGTADLLAHLTGARAGGGDPVPLPGVTAERQRADAFRAAVLGGRVDRRRFTRVDARTGALAIRPAALESRSDKQLIAQLRAAADPLRAALTLHAVAEFALALITDLLAPDGLPTVVTEPDAAGTLCPLGSPLAGSAWRETDAAGWELAGVDADPPDADAGTGAPWPGAASTAGPISEPAVGAGIGPAAAGWIAARRAAVRLVSRAVRHQRAAVGELGRRHVDSGLLDDPSQMCMISDAELDEFAAAPDRHGELLRMRSYDYHALANYVPPFLVRGRPEPVVRWDRAAVRRALPQGAVLRGAPVSAGRVRGQAHIVRGPADVTLRPCSPGDVVVLSAGSGAWVPLLGAAAGVVVDRGWSGCEVAIAARERGIPCIVATEDATRQLPARSELDLDGRAGTVGRIEPGRP